MVDGGLKPSQHRAGVEIRAADDLRGLDAISPQALLGGLIGDAQLVGYVLNNKEVVVHVSSRSRPAARRGSIWCLAMESPILNWWPQEHLSGRPSSGQMIR